MHGPASGCGGHGEPTAVGAETTVGVKTTVGAPVDSVIAFGWHSFINPVILGRQMSPVVLGNHLCQHPNNKLESNWLCI